MKGWSKSVWFEWNLGSHKEAGGLSWRKTVMAPTQTFIVTGGNTGLGFECAYALTKHSSVLVIIACRDVQKGEKAAGRLRETKGNAKVLP